MLSVLISILKEIYDSLKQKINIMVLRHSLSQEQITLKT